MSWLGRALAVLRAVLDAFLGNNPGQAAAEETLAFVRRELTHERSITAALRLRIVAKEARIRELEKTLAERDPGALLDSVFGGQPPG